MSHADEIASLQIPNEILELVPNSVAHYNCLVPVAVDGDTLFVLLAKQSVDADPELPDVLTFILNRYIRYACVDYAVLQPVVDRYYDPPDDDPKEIEFFASCQPTAHAR